MEYRKSDYDAIIEKIAEAINHYENSPKNNYTLFLSNGDTIKYSINEFNISHLLGVDFKKFIALNIMDKENYYKLLKKLIDDPYKYWTEIMRNSLVLTDLFSPHINEKLDNFNEQIKIPYPNQIYFICKYDRTRNYMAKEIDGLYSDYFIARKNNDGDIVLLGLIKDQNSNMYLPQTSRTINNDELLIDNLCNIVDNQIITYANGLTIDNPATNYNKSYHLSILEITDTLDKLINISNITNAIPSTIHDHLYNLKTFNKNRTVSYDGKNLLYKIKEEINNRRIVNISEEENGLLDDSIISIIDAYNDLLVNNKLEVKESFTEVKNENKKLKLEYEQLKEELEIEKENILRLNEQLIIKNNEVDSLNKEKIEYDELKEKIITLSMTFKK